MNKPISAFVFLSLLVGCGSPEFSDNRVAELAANDAMIKQLSENAKAVGIEQLFSVDHSRMAEETGEVLDTSKVSFFSNPEINSQILKHDIRAGLDLPYRIHGHYFKKSHYVFYTPADFIRIRHGLAQSAAFENFDQDINSLIKNVPSALPLRVENLIEGYGIIELESEFGFEQTVSQLKSTILAEGDTIWFHDIDYQQQAKDYGVSLPRAKLLVFGAPAPGAAAMRKYPSIGLDAFPQKVLVYEENQKVFVIYNDIPALAKLHYDGTAIAHYVIAYRLKDTLSGAIKISEQQLLDTIRKGPVFIDMGFFIR